MAAVDLTHQQGRMLPVTSTTSTTTTDTTNNNNQKITQLDLSRESVSPTQFGLVTSPGSGLAERIFNDPDAWARLTDMEGPKSAETLSVEVPLMFSGMEDAVRVKQFTNRATLVALSPESDSGYSSGDTGADSDATLFEGVRDQAEKGMYPVSLMSLIQNTAEDKNKKSLQHMSMSFFWSSGTNIFRALPSPAPTPMTPDGSDVDPVTPAKATPPPPLPPLRVKHLSGSSQRHSIGGSTPVSASATWSILDYYGIPKASPKFAPPFLRQISEPPTIGSLLTVPNSINGVALRSAPSSPLKLSSLKVETPLKSSSSSIRPLPTVPDTPRSISAPSSPVRTTAEPPQLPSSERKNSTDATNAKSSIDVDTSPSERESVITSPPRSQTRAPGSLFAAPPPSRVNKPRQRSSSISNFRVPLPPRYEPTPEEKVPPVPSLVKEEKKSEKVDVDVPLAPNRGPSPVPPVPTATSSTAKPPPPQKQKLGKEDVPPVPPIPLSSSSSKRKSVSSKPKSKVKVDEASSSVPPPLPTSSAAGPGLKQLAPVSGTLVAEPHAGEIPPVPSLPSKASSSSLKGLDKDFPPVPPLPSKASSSLLKSKPSKDSLVPFTKTKENKPSALSSSPSSPPSRKSIAYSPPPPLPSQISSNTPTRLPVDLSIASTLERSVFEDDVVRPSSKEGKEGKEGKERKSIRKSKISFPIFKNNDEIERYAFLGGDPFAAAGTGRPSPPPPVPPVPSLPQVLDKTKEEKEKEREKRMSTKSVRRKSSLPGSLAELRKVQDVSTSTSSTSMKGDWEAAALKKREEKGKSSVSPPPPPVPALPSSLGSTSSQSSTTPKMNKRRSMSLSAGGSLSVEVPPVPPLPRSSSAPDTTATVPAPTDKRKSMAAPAPSRPSLAPSGHARSISDARSIAESIQTPRPRTTSLMGDRGRVSPFPATPVSTMRTPSPSVREDSPRFGHTLSPPSAGPGMGHVRSGSAMSMRSVSRSPSPSPASASARSGPMMMEKSNGSLNNLLSPPSASAGGGGSGGMFTREITRSPSPAGSSSSGEAQAQVQAPVPVNLARTQSILKRSTSHLRSGSAPVKPSASSASPSPSSTPPVPGQGILKGSKSQSTLGREPSRSGSGSGNVSFKLPRPTSRHIRSSSFNPSIMSGGGGAVPPVPKRPVMMPELVPF